MYVVGYSLELPPHRGNVHHKHICCGYSLLIKAILMGTHNIYFYGEITNITPTLALYEKKGKLVTENWKDRKRKK